jgi:gonadotropin-releasing hormone receptor
MIVTLPKEECERLNLSTEINSTIQCLSHAPQLTYATSVKAAVLAVLAAASLLANVATIISIHRHRKHRVSSVYRLILHLSIADLFVTFFCLAGESVWSYTVGWYAGNIGCKLFKFMQMFALHLSTFVLVLIGVDRFVAVRYPLNCLTTTTCNRYIACAWILSALCSFPQVSLLYFHSPGHICEFV